MTVPQAIQDLQAIFPATLFLVGGGVRDTLAAEGLEPSDLDLASALSPEQVIEWANANGIGWHVAKNGLEHGTVVLHWQGDQLEVTTFRTDAACNGKHAQVRWASTIEKDLRRRDFTVNAIAINAQTGEIVDPHGGQQDLANRVLRFVGDPAERIQEDWSRLIRLPRFISKLGFIPSVETTWAVHAHAAGISKVAREKLVAEFAKVPASKFGAFALDLYTLGLWQQFSTADPRDAARAQTVEEFLTVLSNGLNAGQFAKDWKLSNAQKEAIASLRLAQGLHDCQKLSQVRVIADQLTIPLVDAARFVGFNHPWIHSPRLQEAPQVTGDDLIARKLRPGPAFREALAEELVAQMDRP